MHYSKRYNDKISYDARAGYHQAQAEGDAVSGRLGPQAQILALSERYAELRRAGRMDEAAELRRQANAIVNEVKV